jgi:predicted Fe-Mo cluster-binding NifX family protein
MLVAATYENGQVFQHFGDTPEFMTYTIEGGKVTAKAPLSTGGANHVGLIPVLADAGVQALIAGGIGFHAVDLLTQAGIKVYAGVSGSADDAAAALAAGTLASDDSAMHQCSHCS